MSVTEVFNRDADVISYLNLYKANFFCQTSRKVSQHCQIVPYVRPK